MRLPRVLRGVRPTARLFIHRADAARDEERWRDAAALYREALLVEPRHAGAHVQAGHMFKEAGDYAAAEVHYAAALALKPDDADLALQLGHFNKLLGRLADAVRSYERAASLKPDWDAPRQELARVRAAGMRLIEEAVDDDVAPDVLLPSDPIRLVAEPRLIAAYGRLAPEQLPRPTRDLLKRSVPSINLVRFGVPLNSFWGLRRVVRGVEAIRGFAISLEPLTEVTALVNGFVIHRGPVKGPYELEYEPDPTRIHKYVFNIWHDFSRLALGRHVLELRFRDSSLKPRAHFEEFVVEATLSEADHPGSDGVIVLDPADPRPAAEQINARPSVVHDAARTNMLPEVRNILVMRPDQLGDLVTSIPALERLRELFPDARIVGLCSPANADLARSLGLFDDLVVSRFDEDITLRARTMGWEAQEALRETLAAYDFDIAIDLASSRMSRPFLMLSGARFRYGFSDPEWPRLDASVDDAFPDPKNRRESAPHSTRILTMIERLAALSRSPVRVIRRDDLPRERLSAFGIGANDRFAVLHMGARIVFSRWAHYVPLAERLFRETDLRIVLFADKPGLRDRLPADMAASDRVVVIDSLLPFDDFDALLSYCDVYVGNDSGPKHLASLRGVPVVSIHSARINWSEWGQEHGGVVVSRKVPCAGCLIYHDVDECGADFVCMTAIRLDEVYAAVRRYV
jgi:ADP-heptose:LPS heptosyltransferase